MERIDVKHLPPRERFETWTVLTEPFFHVSLDADARDAFRCRMRTWRWDEALFVETDVSGQRYDHTLRHARSGGWDQIAFQMYKQGAFRGLYDDTPVAVMAGDVHVIDLSRPYVKESTDEVDLNLILPRGQVESHLPALRHGAVLGSGEALGRLAATHLGSLSSCTGDLGAADAQRAITAFLVLLSGTRLGEDPEILPYLRSTARRTVEDFVRQHLGERTLGVQALMRHCGLSRATLYRLFEADGGVAAYIRRIRLDHARRLIETRPETSLQDIAEVCGFNDPSGFSRMFRREFELSPSDLREARADARTRPPSTPVSWIETVRRYRDCS